MNNANFTEEKKKKRLSGKIVKFLSSAICWETHLFAVLCSGRLLVQFKSCAWAKSFRANELWIEGRRFKELLCRHLVASLGSNETLLRKFRIFFLPLFVVGHGTNLTFFILLTKLINASVFLMSTLY